MYEYKSELLKTGLKLIKDGASSADVSNLDELINKQAAEGWELVTYVYMAEVFGVRGTFLATFKKQK